MQDFLLSADALFPESSSQISLSAADLGHLRQPLSTPPSRMQRPSSRRPWDTRNLSCVHLRNRNKILYTDPVPYDDGT